MGAPTPSTRWERTPLTLGKAKACEGLRVLAPRTGPLVLRRRANRRREAAALTRL
jgi:hypothetical protein